MTEFYWELIQHDGTRLEIPPSGVESIKRRMDNGQPIHTAHSGSIPSNQIKAFRPTEKPFSDQLLIEEVAQAFDEPIMEGESVQARWVKKHVTQNKWEKFYSPSGYKILRQENGMVVVGFRVPTHLINPSVTPYCNEQEITLLNKQ